MTPATGQGWHRFRALSLPRWLDIALWAALTFLAARLIWLPQARPLAAADALSAPAGQWLTLNGIPQDAAITITTPLAGEASFNAGQAALDPATRTYLASVGVAAADVTGPLRWSAGVAGGAPGNLIATIAVTQPDTSITVSLIPGGSGLKLRADRGGITISVRIETDNAARGLIDAPGGTGPLSYGPGRPITFALAAGQSSELRFGVPKSLDLWLQGDGLDGPIPLTSAEIGGDGGIAARICGGEAGDILFGSSLFQPRLRPIPARAHCQPAHMTIGAVSFGTDAIIAKPSGSAYVAGELPIWSTIKANPALTALFAALIAYPGLRLTGLLKIGKDAAPAPAKLKAEQGKTPLKPQSRGRDQS